MPLRVQNSLKIQTNWSLAVSTVYKVKGGMGSGIMASRYICRFLLPNTGGNLTKTNHSAMDGQCGHCIERDNTFSL